MRLFDCGCRRPRQRVTVSVEVELPAAYYRRINKATLRRRETKIVAAIWDRAVYHCERCGRIKRPKDEDPRRGPDATLDCGRLHA